MKRILIVEDALKDFKGHWFEQISCIYNAGEAFNTIIDVACNKNVIHEISTQIKVFPIFKYSYFLDTSKKIGIKNKLTSYIKFYIDSFFSLWQVIKAEDKYDIIFLPTATIHHVLYLLFINLFHPNKPNRIIPLFLNPPGKWNDKKKEIQFPKSAVYFKLLIKLFNISKRTLLAVQTNNAKITLEKYTKCSFKVLHQPIDFNKPNNYPNNTYKTQLTFGCFGAERYEKGTDILVKAIEKLISQGYNISFKIQWINGFRDPMGTQIKLPSLFYNNDNIQVFSSHLSDEDYNFEINNTDCVILPYRNSSYYFRDSRVALEATTRGTPIIYTKGGWLEEFAMNYETGIGFEDENVNALVNAIKTMTENYNSHKEKAEYIKSKVLSHFSPSNFINKLRSI